MESFVSTDLISHYTTTTTSTNTSGPMTNNHTRNKRRAADNAARRTAPPTANVVHWYQPVLILSTSSTSKALQANETPTTKQRDLSVSGYKLLCSSRNLAMLTEVVSAPLEVSKAIDRQYQWYVIALTGHRAI